MKTIIKINFKDETKYVNTKIFGKIILEDDKNRATEFDDQKDALEYLSLISKHLSDFGEVKKIEIIEI